MIISSDCVFRQSHPPQREPCRLPDELFSRHAVIDHGLGRQLIEHQRDGQMVDEPGAELLRDRSCDGIARLDGRSERLLDLREPARRDCAARARWRIRRLPSSSQYQTHLYGIIVIGGRKLIGQFRDQQMNHHNQGCGGRFERFQAFDLS